MNIVKNIIISILIISLTNCIGIRHHKVPETSSQDTKTLPSAKLKIFTNWKFGSLRSNAPVSKIHAKNLVQTIKEADCCVITNDESEADIVLNGTFYNETSATALVFAAISGFTLTTIPSWANAKMHIVANVKKGKKTYDYDLQDSAFLAFWLPLIVTIPFHTDSINTEGRMQNNLYRNLILEMKKDGLFENK